MRTHVEFRSSKFPPTDGEDELANPGIHGRRLAEYLQSELAKRSVQTGEAFAEDWGWVVPLPNQPFTMWLGCSNYQEYEDGHLCLIEPSRPYIRRWLRRIDTREAVEHVASLLDTILRSDPEIRDVRWWTDKSSA